MAVFSEGGWTSPDIYIGISCVCLAVLCAVLNFLVLIHNYHKNPSVARNLYLSLAAADLLTAFVILVPYSVNVLKKSELDCREKERVWCDDAFMRKSVASIFNKLQAILTWTVILAPNHITAFLALTRYIQIRHPLQHLETKHVLLALFFSLTWEPVIFSCSFLYVSEDNILYLFKLQNALVTIEQPQLFGVHMTWPTFLVIVNIVNITLQFFAMIASFLTIIALIKSYLKPVAGSSTSTSNRRSKSALRIVIMNFGSFISLASCANVLSLEDRGVNSMSTQQAIKLLLTTLIIPSVLSSLNPMIYINLTSSSSLIKSKLLPSKILKAFVSRK
jgi:hypothetical protein